MLSGLNEDRWTTARHPIPILELALSRRGGRSPRGCPWPGAPRGVAPRCRGVVAHVARVEDVGQHDHGVGVVEHEVGGLQELESPPRRGLGLDGRSADQVRLREQQLAFDERVAVGDRNVRQPAHRSSRRNSRGRSCAPTASQRNPSATLVYQRLPIDTKNSRASRSLRSAASALPTHISGIAISMLWAAASHVSPRRSTTSLHRPSCSRNPASSPAASARRRGTRGRCCRRSARRAKRARQRSPRIRRTEPGRRS